MDEQQRISDVASSPNSSSKKYDVFLSFHGEDTRMNFTSLLYDALTRAKIETFIDNQLEKGNEISPALIKAIKDSHISIVVFSENYASSKWCLDELSKIMKLEKQKRQIVIPVFYKVDPSDVRHQTGSYKEALAKHEGHSMCSEWKAALREAANLCGWHSQNRIESELLKDIVQDVLQKLAPTYPNQLKGLVGIEKSCEEIESLLKIGSSEVITLGIWGMGGIGKTTLAKSLYDKLSYQFEGHCFLEKVRENSGNLEGLRKELFSTLLEEEKCQFNGFDMSRLQRKKVFIVLDDVSDPEQLEKLIAEYDFLGAGSRVIVTTRNRQILGESSQVYEVVKLNPGPSLELFCLTVFEEKQPKQGYEDLSRRVISYCKGVPLALKVLGASLRKISKEEWECELRKVQEIPNMNIHKVLKLSYDGLDRSQKDIFLDIACFFKGEERDRVTGILEASGFYAVSGIATLLHKALITISHANKIEMHDLIQEMGREIVHQESEKYPENRSRLWKYEEVFDVLKDNKGTDDVEGIILNLAKLKGDLYLSSDFLAKMTNVRFLKIHKEHWWRWGDEFKVYLHDGLESLTDKLSYLHWDSCSLESRLPKFCAERLVELRMQYSNLKKLWDGVQNLMNLKSIDLSYSPKLVEMPDLSKAEKLEKVSLACCYSLHQLHPSVLSLPKLTYLDLNFCGKIESLESNVRSKSLKELTLRGCSSLKKFSVTSDEIKVLNLSNIPICALSQSIGHLLSLEVLDLSGSNVESLPENIRNLSMLTSLGLEDCKELVSLPELPPSLRELSLNKCKNLVSLLELPSSLTELSLNECENLVSLSDLPSSLTELSLNDCKNLVSLSELPSSLEALYLNDCRQLKSLPELPSSLTELYLNDCWKLESLPKLPLSLGELPLDNCEKLMSLPELPRTMKKVTAYNCISLKTDITQGLVLKHMLQYLKNPKFCGLDYFIFPGDHVIKECGFHAAESLITIPYLPKSDLCGFIYCIIFSERQDLDYWVDDWEDDVSIYIDQDGIEVGRENIKMHCWSDLYSDHVFFSYVDISRLGRITEVDDQFVNITFKFELKYNKERIKGCGVFPVYATTSGLKLVGHDQENVLEYKSIAQILDNEEQARAIGVGGSNNENEDGSEQLPPSKRQRTSP